MANHSFMEDFDWRPFSDSDELLPVEGKDKEYDQIIEEIAELEETLEAELEKLKKKVG